MRKIAAVLLIIMLVLCGCTEEVYHDTAVAPTLPQKSEITDNEYGIKTAKIRDISSVENGTTEQIDIQETVIAGEQKAVTEEEQTSDISLHHLYPVQTPEPEIDIAYWVSFAKNTAVNCGLNLNSNAVACWDNPIAANGKSVYLERDITDRLNRYATDEDISDVWIWYEALGNGSYSIYIGYA